MSQRKYFFFDIDGTLTEKVSRKVVPSALEAIRKLKEAGHFVSICTGRAYYKSEPFRAENGFDHMVCNGGHGIVIDGQLVENAPLAYEQARAVYDQARELGYGVLVQVDESEKVYTKDFRFYDQVGPRREPTIYVIDEHYDPKDFGKIYKMYVSIAKEEEDRLTLKDTVGHLRFMPEYLMFQPDEKDQGILRMLELVGGDPKDVVVFGDDDNDLIMFIPPFTRVAMGNACAALKEQADFIAKPNVEDGIYDFCLEQGWFDPVVEEESAAHSTESVTPEV